MGIFSKKDNETYQEYRDRSINKISKTFCGAKWYNATIWLGNGTTTSCHHPPAHKIPLEELKVSYKAIHNTQYKKLVRKEMLEGKRPKECEYCWKMEDMGKDVVSDRVYKSVIYTDKELNDAKDVLGWKNDVDLKTLEVAFDPNCNFACSYCNSSFSTVWQKDINKNGPYENLVSDGAGAFQHNGAHALPYGKNNDGNPYIEAFWKWWEAELQFSLRELRVTGGEPMMSKNFWKLMKWWNNNPDCDVEFAVNSNLGNDKLLDQLIKYSHNFKVFHLYTSCEATELKAEYIRDGLVWDSWINNMYKVLEKGKITSLNIMLTINALSLFSLTDFMDEMIKIKEKFGQKFSVCSFNVLRFPSFQSIVTLPKKIRIERSNHIEKWLELNKSKLLEIEVDSMVRMISYIREIETGHRFTSSIESRERDWKSFYTQYDLRRNKNFVEAFPELKEWYNSLPITELSELKGLIDGDDSKTNFYVSEVMKKANNEGWVLKPQMSNPGSKDYIEEEEHTDLLKYIKDE